MLYLSITIKSSGELIGCDHRWFGCDIEAIQAVIKHCFKVNAIHRVSLSVFANNQVELKHYKELGFIEEGRRRAVYGGPGEWEDIIDLGMLDSDYFGKAT
ncbi:hypothetical protein FB107DRAFT_277678 [Schizophyllum commune]